ncbi:MAG TPA: hypothetical protein ENI26_02030 [Methylophaga aminisulfidivorans]|uniref:Uncharacterized protein n=2 Tax=root TaxID=1 RepID=A0A7C2A5T4_9GAMM|nr:hypothetical protein [Methylophaga aminisulfidivorans]
MSYRIVYGIDPDSDKHGVAIYVEGRLMELKAMSLMELIGAASTRKEDKLFSIEDVMANQFVYTRNQKSSKAQQSKIAMHIGRCQQAQVELMRALDNLGIPYQLHKPQRGNWAKNKEQFRKVTGWDGRSNEDTRSAAYFGFLSLEAKA